MKQIKIHSDYITLQQLLKMENVISSGGEAKYYLSINKVYVNQELENRRGRKLYPNDKIVIDEKEFVIE
ncbi:MAG: S4 domain-containing protein YaaA [Anaeroplasmataceae bacterium]|nr:S4 domain-containing protein YaaA [Anaeroplasmataceae bacterium]